MGRKISDAGSLHERRLALCGADRGHEHLCESSRSLGKLSRRRLGNGHIARRKLVIGGQQVVGSRTSAIASPSGGTIIDTEARATIDQILTALRGHGLIDTY